MCTFFDESDTFWNMQTFVTVPTSAKSQGLVGREKRWGREGRGQSSTTMLWLGTTAKKGLMSFGKPKDVREPKVGVLPTISDLVPHASFIHIFGRYKISKLILCIYFDLRSILTFPSVSLLPVYPSLALPMCLVVVIG